MKGTSAVRNFFFSARAFTMTYFVVFVSEVPAGTVQNGNLPIFFNCRCFAFLEKV